MEKQIKKSLALFEEIYFKPDGNFDIDGFAHKHYISSHKKYNLAKDDSFLGDNNSQIIGKSVFTPRIIERPIKKTGEDGKETVVGHKYFLTLDNQGILGHHFDSFYGSNLRNIREIDVTNMPKQGIMEKVEQILNMSNEEIIELFNIKKTYSTKLKLALIIDDISLKYFESKGAKVTERSGDAEQYIETKTDYGMIRQASEYYASNSESEIDIAESTDRFGLWTDEIYYKVLTPEEDEISKIRIEINYGDERFKRTDVNSELGKLILDTLKERFTEREEQEAGELVTELLSKEQPRTESRNVNSYYSSNNYHKSEFTGVEKLRECIKANPYITTHDVSLVYAEMLAKESDRTNAEKHLIETMEQGKTENKDPIVQE